MGKYAIRVENLGKQYTIGAYQGRYKSLRDSLTSAVKAPFRRFGKNAAEEKEARTIWALKDVSFEIEHGEVVGIIGRNGAGKSTLLKILARITEPTTGEMRMRGRVGSLLEVGTGFHPELTGRENIFLNGAILGMSRKEIQRKFDEIVDFAEIEKFIDTPAKHYSSGMYMRLAFAVAAHLEPEILLVDEVLAVGDAQFQKKCLGKMGEVAKEGRTVLFVSHNMSAIENLCPKSIYLRNGSVSCFGDTIRTIEKYLNNSKDQKGQENLSEKKNRDGTGEVKFVSFMVYDENDVPQGYLQSGKNYNFVMELQTHVPNKKYSNVVVSIGMTDERGQMVFLVRSNFDNQNINLMNNNAFIHCFVNDFQLTQGTYNVTLFISYKDTYILDLVEDAAILTVVGGDYFGTGSIGLPHLCKVLTRANWKVT